MSLRMADGEFKKDLREVIKRHFIDVEFGLMDVNILVENICLYLSSLKALYDSVSNTSPSKAKVAKHGG